MYRDDNDQLRGAYAELERQYHANQRSQAIARDTHGEELARGRTEVELLRGELELVKRAKAEKDTLLSQADKFAKDNMLALEEKLAAAQHPHMALSAAERLR